MANEAMIEIAILPTAMTERHHQAVEHHAPHRRGGTALRARDQHLRVVLPELVARHQRHRHLDDLVEREGGGDEGDVQRERDHRDAGDQHRVRKNREPGPVLDHQYWTFRSTKRNCTTVRAMTMIIRTTDCAEEPPRSCRLHAVVVHLVDQDLGRLSRPARGGGVDHAEGLEERVDDVDHQQEEGGRRKQREHDGPEAPRTDSAPSIAAASISERGIDCSPARKNRKL